MSSEDVTSGFESSPGHTGLGKAWRPKPRWWRRKSVVGLALLLLFTWWFVPPVWRLISGPVEVTRYEKKKGETRAVVGPGQKGWTSTKRISKHALNAVVSAEDGKFYQHHGIDWESTYESFRTNLKKKRYARGGSTISQQVVKMAFLDRDKNLIRKAREAVGTLLMELILPKDKILEWYINLAEFGDGVYSVADGARHYFNTKPELLTIEQSVHLALVLPSPNRWSRGLRSRVLSSFGHRRFAAILNNMRNSGFVTKGQWAGAITRGDFGRPINGYARLLAAQEQNKPLCPGSPGCPQEESEDPIEGYDEDAQEVSSPAAPEPAPVVPMGETTTTVPVRTSSPGAVGNFTPPPATKAVGTDAEMPPIAPSVPETLKAEDETREVGGVDTGIE